MKEIYLVIDWGDIGHAILIMIGICCVLFMIYLMKLDSEIEEEFNKVNNPVDIELSDYEKELGEICDTSKDMSITPLNKDDLDINLNKEEIE